MTPAVEQLVRETIELTGTRQPALFDDDAPVLSADELRSAGQETDGETGFYLVGLIGGKEVGKSALVNALAGNPITNITSHGPGTEIAIAYAHTSQAIPLRHLLETHVPGKFRIVSHSLPNLRRQVLLDLPDIDSHYESHVAVTRAMLRHMLFPVWVQSVEKYADMQPHQMLKTVASGNAAENFVFCLNKVDQLRDRDNPVANVASETNPSGVSPEVLELRDDYAARLQKTLSLAKPPRVFLISAKSPGNHDLPALREIVCKEKSKEAVRESRALAGRQQDRSLASWLKNVDLKSRAQQLGRLRETADEMMSTRVTAPLIEQVLPKLTDDPANRQALADDILNDRMTNWPLLGLVHALLAPLFLLIRTMGAKNVAPLQGPEALTEFYLREESAGGWPAARAIQSTFALLRQSQPIIGTLYGEARLWEDLPAQQAADDLRRRLAATILRQREAMRSRIRGGNQWFAKPLRWLLTIGALLWFPLIQPVLQGALSGPVPAWASFRAFVLDIVTVLGADYLARSLGFLAIYFLVLWIALRWNTQRNVARLSARWLNNRDSDPEVNLAAQTMQWVEELTEPVHRAHKQMESLSRRADALGAAIK